MVLEQLSNPNHNFDKIVIDENNPEASRAVIVNELNFQANLQKNKLTAEEGIPSEIVDKLYNLEYATAAQVIQAERLAEEHPEYGNIASLAIDGLQTSYGIQHTQIHNEAWPFHTKNGMAKSQDTQTKLLRYGQLGYRLGVFKNCKASELGTLWKNRLQLMPAANRGADAFRLSAPPPTA